jgi:hypothetical protein
VCVDDHDLIPVTSRDFFSPTPRDWLWDPKSSLFDKQWELLPQE